MNTNLSQLGDFLDGIRRIGCPDRVGARLLALFQDNGAHAANIWHGYDYHDNTFGTYPREWRQHIYHMGWGTRHHVCLLSKKSMRPVFWGQQITPSDPLANEAGRRVVETAADAFNARAAVTFPVHCADSAYDGGVSMVTSLDRAEFGRLMNERLPNLQAAAIGAHDHVQRLIERSPRAHAGSTLTPRERDCLVWLANGLRTGQIADRLNISESAVNLYIRNAKTRLGARTREQLIARALVQGQIEP